MGTLVIWLLTSLPLVTLALWRRPGARRIVRVAVPAIFLGGAAGVVARAVFLAKLVEGPEDWARRFVFLIFTLPAVIAIASGIASGVASRDRLRVLSGLTGALAGVVVAMALALVLAWPVPIDLDLVTVVVTLVVPSAVLGGTGAAIGAVVLGDYLADAW